MLVIDFLSGISPFSGVLAFISFLGLVFCFIAGIHKKKVGKWFFVNGCVLMTTMCVSFFQGYYMKSFLHEISSQGSVLVSWNGVELENSQNVLLQLSEFSYSKINSGSSPMDKNLVRIQFDNSVLEFDLKRDSNEKSLYWIYYPKFVFKSELGFVYLQESMIK